MLPTAIIVMRVLLVGAVTAAIFAPKGGEGSFDWRRAAIIAAVVLALLLLGARVGLRSRTPDQLPKPTG